MNWNSLQSAPPPNYWKQSLP